MTTELRWVASVSASCFHATALLARRASAAEGRETAHLLGAPLAAALEEPTEELSAVLADARIAAEPFFAHLVPLSAGIENNRELALVALGKVAGPGRAEQFAQSATRVLTWLEQVFTTHAPGLIDELFRRSGPLREQWEARGPGLLAAVRRQCEPGILPEGADIILVRPAIGGGGTAHLPYNSVTFEAVLANPLPALPEVVRLGWLLAMLNQDLPRFSEMVSRDRLPQLAALALLPPVLAAAEEVELVPSAVQALPLALAGWRLVPAAGDELAETIDQWWQTYCDSRPAWRVALQALDRMLADRKLAL
jgi:hypothetical protein